MRSSDIAALAGVTVRTLRHYHQIGVLPEPPRTSNGYRTYSGADLVRLLRITQLTRLGIPLEKVDAILEQVEPDTAVDALRELDDDLTDRIAALTRQRDQVRQLIDARTDADLPLHIGRYVAGLETTTVTPATRAAERDHAIVLHRLVSDASPALATRLATELGDTETTRRAVEAFDRLPAEAAPEEIARVTDAFVALVSPFVRELRALPGPPAAAATMIASLQDATMNRAQRQALRMISDRLLAAGAPEASGSEG